MEELVPLKNWEGFYSITRDGRIWSHPRDYNSRFKGQGFWLTPHLDGCGYYFVALTLNGKTIQPKLHRLIAENFIPNPKNLPIVNHLDGNKQNNNINNLAWCTQKENIIHSFTLGMSCQKGENNAASKLKEKDIIEIRKLANEGTLKKEIAKKFNVSNSAITNIVKRKRWKHVI